MRGNRYYEIDSSTQKKEVQIISEFHETEMMFKK